MVATTEQIQSVQELLKALGHVDEAGVNGVYDDNFQQSLDNAAAQLAADYEGLDASQGFSAEFINQLEASFKNPEMQETLGKLQDLAAVKGSDGTEAIDGIDSMGEKAALVGINAAKGLSLSPEQASAIVHLSHHLDSYLHAFRAVQEHGAELKAQQAAATAAAEELSSTPGVETPMDAALNAGQGDASTEPQPVNDGTGAVRDESVSTGEEPTEEPAEEPAENPAGVDAAAAPTPTPAPASTTEPSAAPTVGTDSSGGDQTDPASQPVEPAGSQTPAGSPPAAAPSGAQESTPALTPLQQQAVLSAEQGMIALGGLSSLIGLRAPVLSAPDGQMDGQLRSEINDLIPQVGQKLGLQTTGPYTQEMGAQILTALESFHSKMLVEEALAGVGGSRGFIESLNVLYSGNLLTAQQSDPAAGAGAQGASRNPLDQFSQLQAGLMDGVMKFFMEKLLPAALPMIQMFLNRLGLDIDLSSMLPEGVNMPECDRSLTPQQQMAQTFVQAVESGQSLDDVRKTITEGFKALNKLPFGDKEILPAYIAAIEEAFKAGQDVLAQDPAKLNEAAQAFVVAFDNAETQIKLGHGDLVVEQSQQVVIDPRLADLGIQYGDNLNINDVIETYNEMNEGVYYQNHQPLYFEGQDGQMYVAFIEDESNWFTVQAIDEKMMEYVGRPPTTTSDEALAARDDLRANSEIFNLIEQNHKYGVASLQIIKEVRNAKPLAEIMAEQDVAPENAPVAAGAGEPSAAAPEEGQGPETSSRTHGHEAVRTASGIRYSGMSPEEKQAFNAQETDLGKIYHATDLNVRTQAQTRYQNEVGQKPQFYQDQNGRVFVDFTRHRGNELSRDQHWGRDITDELAAGAQDHTTLNEIMNHYDGYDMDRIWAEMQAQGVNIARPENNLHANAEGGASSVAVDFDDNVSSVVDPISDMAVAAASTQSPEFTRNAGLPTFT